MNEAMNKKWLLLLLCIFVMPLAANERFVVGIHGLMSKADDMNTLKKRLECAGMHVYLMDYPSTDGTICQHANELRSYLLRVAECRPGQPIDFVTHSVGAIILRQALNIEGCPEEAKMGRAVLIAPPNQGSRLAREFHGFLPAHWALGSKIGTELMSYTPCTIQSLGAFPDTMQVLVIAGCRGNSVFFDEPNDGFLTVEETYLETPHYFQLFRLRHGALLTNPASLSLTTSFLYYGMEDEKCEDEKESEDH